MFGKLHNLPPMTSDGPKWRSAAECNPSALVAMHQKSDAPKLEADSTYTRDPQGPPPRPLWVSPPPPSPAVLSCGSRVRGSRGGVRPRSPGSSAPLTRSGPGRGVTANTVAPGPTHRGIGEGDGTRAGGGGARCAGGDDRGALASRGGQDMWVLLGAHCAPCEG